MSQEDLKNVYQLRMIIHEKKGKKLLKNRLKNQKEEIDKTNKSNNLYDRSGECRSSKLVYADVKKTQHSTKEHFIETHEGLRS